MKRGSTEKAANDGRLMKLPGVFGRSPHIFLYALGLAGAWSAERQGSNAQHVILALGIPIFIMSSKRKSAPGKGTVALWIALAVMLIPGGIARIFPVLYTVLPGFGGSYPPTRFLLIPAVASLFAGFRRWDVPRFTFWHAGLLFLWITVCTARSYEIYKRLGYGYDLAHVLNLLDNTLEGRFLFSDYMSASILSHHLFLTLPLLAPFYFFVHSPFLPQAAQILLMGASALILPYAITRRFGQDAGISSFFTFLMHPAFQGQILHEFDPGVIGLFALSLAVFGYCEKIPPLFWSACVVAMLSKEHFAVAGIITGAVCMFGTEYRREGKILVGCAAAALVGFVLCSFFIPSSFDLGTQIKLRTGGSIFTPILEIFRPAKLGYLLHMFLPNGGLALLSWPIVLTCLPELAINVTSRFPMHQLSSHYSTLSLPVLALATAYAVSRCVAKDHELGRWAAKYVVCASLASAIFSNIGPISHSLAFYDVLRTERNWQYRHIDSMIARIPNGTVGVRGNHRLLIYLSKRRPATDLPYLDTRGLVESRDFLILDQYSGAPPAGYTLVESEDRTFVYARKRGTAR